MWSPTLISVSVTLFRCASRLPKRQAFRVYSGRHPRRAFIPGCDKIEEMMDGFANDMEQYGAGDQLVSERVYWPWESE